MHASPQLYELVKANEPLQETLAKENITFRSVLPYALRMLFLLCSFFFCLIVIGGGINNVVEAAIALLLISTLCSFVVAIQLPGRAWMHRKLLPRTVRVNDGVVTIAHDTSHECSELTDCAWYFGSTSPDALCAYTGLRKGIVIVTPKSRVAVGHTQSARDNFAAFFALAGVQEIRPPRLLLRFGLVVAGALAGFVVGGFLGFGIATMLNNENWLAALPLVAIADGMMLSWYSTSWRYEGAKAARRRTHPIKLGLIFLSWGALFGHAADPVWGGVALGSINAALGVCLGLFCRNSINQAADERRAMFEFRA